MQAEGGGFVLLDPQRVERAVAGARGQDLLALFLQTTWGDQVARAGMAIPVLGVDPGGYDLVMHATDAPGPAGPVVVRAPGWVLETTTGRLQLGPLAALTGWDPAGSRQTWVTVPPGAYAVEVRGHLPVEGESGCAGSYAWVLRPTAALPWFTADLALG